MTTSTAQLPRSIRKPLITAIVGALVFAAGLILGRIPYTVEGYHWSAMQVDSLCRSFNQVTGTAATDPACAYAHAVLEVCGLLIVAGGAPAATGITMAVVRRLRDRVAQPLAGISGRAPSSRDVGPRMRR